MENLNPNAEGSTTGGGTTPVPKKKSQFFKSILAFFTKDHLLHIGCCFLIAIGVALLAHAFGLNTSASGVIGFFIALIAGVCKETYDVYQSLNPSSFSWKDILADVIGTVAGSALWFILTAGAFDFEQFLIYGFACSLLSVFAGCFSFPFVCTAIETKALKKKGK